MVFFLVYSFFTFRGKRPRNLMLNCCVFFLSYTIFSFKCILRRAEGYFFLYDCYVLGHYRRSKCNYQESFFIFDPYILIKKLLLIVQHYIGCLSVQGVLRQHGTGLQCSVVWSLLGNIAQSFYLFNDGPWVTDNFYEENNLRNVVLTMLGQHCIGILSSQCFLNMSKTTYAMLTKDTQTCFCRKISCTMLPWSVWANIAQENYLCNVDHTVHKQRHIEK